ncbi:MAG: NAD(P)-dependent oxidoreductase [Thermoplasmatales archaeon]|nr:NAD(P)-dependent oxidoreductase [Thermoplasmatales archaeon]
MKILLSRGAGFVGRNLLRVLSSNDYDMSKVTVLDKDKTNLEYVKKYGIKTVLVDLAEKGEWYKEFKGKDIVINLVAEISSQEYEPFYRNNVLATKNILEAAEEVDEALKKSFILVRQPYCQLEKMIMLKQN